MKKFYHSPLLLILFLLKVSIKNLSKLFKQRPSFLTMFKKKRCRNCGRKVNSNYDFCPYCGAQLKDSFEDSGDWGLLGKDDFSYEGMKLSSKHFLILSSKTLTNR